MKKILFCLTICLMLSGCYTQHFPIKSTQAPTVPTYEGTSHFVFWGIGQTKTINPKDVCGTKDVLAVNTHTSFWQGLVSTLTYGIYAPRGHAVYCKQD